MSLSSGTWQIWIFLVTRQVKLAVAEYEFTP